MRLGRRRFLASVAALSLPGCGGGGGSAAAPEFIGTAPTPYRPGILYGYWGDDAEMAADTADHSNLYVVADWNGGAAGAISNIDRAKKAGFTELLVIMDGVRPTVDASIDAVNAYMADLARGGALDGMNLRGIAWGDEPNSNERPGGALSEDFVRAVNIGLRTITTAPLWCIYADKPGRPGLAAGDDPRGAFDVVGIDQYDIGCNVLGALNLDLKQRMKPGARRVLVPGPVGGHMSQTDPTCFENYAYANPDVLAIVTFIWIDRWSGIPTNQGIHSIPALRATYTALGKRITGRA